MADQPHPIWSEEAIEAMRRALGAEGKPAGRGDAIRAFDASMNLFQMLPGLARQLAPEKDYDGLRSAP